MRISAEHLVVRYAGRDAPALDDVSFEIPSGTLYVVLGPNGSGKSTLMRAVLGVVRPERGRVLMDGRETAAWSGRERARLLAAVPQFESIAFPLTTREMVAMGRYPHLPALAAEGPDDRAAIAAALEACDVADLASRDVTTLSGGEFQRARIARALAQAPEAMMLDEPTASLDIRHEMGILELLRASADQGMTVVLITHGLDTAARFADRMLLLSGGRIAAEGTPSEVIREDILAEVYGWPVSVNADPETGTPRVTPKPSVPRPRPPRP